MTRSRRPLVPLLTWGVKDLSLEIGDWGLVLRFGDWRLELNDDSLSSAFGSASGLESKRPEFRIQGFWPGTDL